MAGGWASLGLLPELVHAIEHDNEEEEDSWLLPTDVQDETIPLLLGGSDVMVSSVTGSGKTAAFVLPSLQLCYERKLNLYEERERIKGEEEQRKKDDGGGGGGGGDDANNNKESNGGLLLPFKMFVQDRDTFISIHPSSNGLIVQSRGVRTWSGCRCSGGICVYSSSDNNDDYDEKNEKNKEKEERREKKRRGYYFECTVTTFSKEDASLLDYDDKDKNGNDGNKKRKGGGKNNKKKLHTTTTTRDNVGLVRIGLGTADAKLNLGTDIYGYGYGGTGLKVHDDSFTPYPAAAGDNSSDENASDKKETSEEKVTFGHGDVIGCLLTLHFIEKDEEERTITKNNDINQDSNKKEEVQQDRHEEEKKKKKKSICASISYYKNGDYLGKAFDMPIPNPNPHGRRASLPIPLVLYPMVTMKNAECALNFGSFEGDMSCFAYPPISDFKDDEECEKCEYLPFASVSSSSSSSMKENGDGVINPRYLFSNNNDNRCNDNIAGDAADDNAKNNKGDSNKRIRSGPMAIIIEPTKDLAEQTYKCFQKFAQHLPPLPSTTTTTATTAKQQQQQPIISCSLLVGASSSTKQTITKCKQNKVDILIGTPLIISKNIQNSTIQTSDCFLFILDEADVLSNKEHVDLIHIIYNRLPKNLDNDDDKKRGGDLMNRLQVCFFSATLHSRDVTNLTRKICHFPLWVDLKGDRRCIGDNNDGNDDGNDEGRGQKRGRQQFLPETVHHCVINIDPTKNENLLQGEEEDDEGMLVKTDGVHKKGEIIPTTADLLSSLSSEDANSERIKVIKPHVLVSIIEQFDMDQVLVFCRTNLDCNLLEEYLTNMGRRQRQQQLQETKQDLHNTDHNEQMPTTDIALQDKYSCRVLAGMRSMSERRASLEAFKNGSIRILIATDVASRGIDIRELPFVVNMTLPLDDTSSSRTYVHRVGRVGRAERIGLAVSLVSSVKEKVWFCQGGVKPPCEDCRLFGEGGNCKWYNEAKIWNDIEKLLTKNKTKVTKLNWPNLNITAEMETLLKTGVYGGLASGKSSNPELEDRIQKISSKIGEISDMEFMLQSEFWRMKKDFLQQQ